MVSLVLLQNNTIFTTGFYGKLLVFEKLGVKQF